ncbi:uncharacterized protein J7T54_006618 [Emericellopsis cladophorae]|uniref:Thioesterase domain-containing protein n=1 Tax=Emericellopsis cladophorae TaxID=2686198 RepID=A0A9P9Y6P1_9HYPO|nr:uncharacterized protein J7T54_006618 [Emericellopsis cladophorae]KAI6784573.1 hypothetical protein J7T54_006618 [Emericellopsis cladophorae]
MKESGLEPTLLGANRFRITDASNGRVDFELDIHQNHTTIHGGTLAAMVDLGGSLAVASTGRFATGVTTDLNGKKTLHGNAAGDMLTGTAICDKIGKTLAYTTIIFKNSKGQLAARGSHTKYVAGTLGEEGPFMAPAKYAEELD